MKMKNSYRLKLRRKREMKKVENQKMMKSERKRQGSEKDDLEEVLCL